MSGQGIFSLSADGVFAEHKRCRYPFRDQYERIWPLDIDSLTPGDFVYPNSDVDDIYRPLSQKPIIWLAWKEASDDTQPNATQSLVPRDDRDSTFWLDLLREEDKAYRRDIMLPTSQTPFQVGMFGGGDGTQNLQIVEIDKSTGCHTREAAWYVYNWKIPRGIVHEYTYRFRLRVEGASELVSHSAPFFLNATQREKIVGGRIELAPYDRYASQARHGIPLSRRIRLAMEPLTDTDNLLLVAILVLFTLLVGSLFQGDSHVGQKKRTDCEPSGYAPQRDT